MFTDQDVDGKQPVVVVNETMVRRHFHGADPIGRRLRFPPFATNARVIVGVVGDNRMQGLESNIEPAVYVPFEQVPSGQFSLLIRSGSDPAMLAAAVRREILAVDPDQPVSDVRSMKEVLANSLLVRRLAVWMLASFAALALLLAVVGIYGLTSYSVSRRRQEIGIRIALGASQRSIVKMIVWHGIVTALIGIGLGAPAAFALARLMKALLFGITATDLITYIAVSVVIIAAAALASYIPVARALKIDPVVALRYE
jgi:putative ABC transport system permease protein